MKNNKVLLLDNLNIYNQIAGVYIICDDSEIKLYCGQTIDLNRRIKSHINTLKDERASKFCNNHFGWDYSNILSPSVFNDKWTVEVFPIETYKTRIELELEFHRIHKTLLSIGGNGHWARGPTAGTHAHYGETNTNWKKLPWHSPRATAESIKAWSYLPILYSVWSSENHPGYRRLSKIFENKFNISITPYLILNMEKYFKSGNEFMNNILVKHSAEDFKILELHAT